MGTRRPVSLKEWYRTLEGWRAHLKLLGDVVETNGGNSLLGHCAAHDDTNPSLAVDLKSNGSVLAVCRSQRCAWDDILAAFEALDPDKTDTRSEEPAPDPDFKPGKDAFANLATHCGISKQRLIELDLPIADGGKGEPIFQWPSGARKVRHWAGDAKSTWNPSGTSPVWPVKDEMPEVAWFCEGESDTIVLRALGVAAYSLGSTSSLTTAAQWEAMKDRGLRQAILAGDMDAPGRKADVGRLATALEAGLTVATAPVPGYDPLTGANKDWRDWHRHGGTQLPAVKRPSSVVQTMAEFVAAHEGDILDPVIEGLAYRGIVSLVAGPMKGGKTTLIKGAIECLMSGSGFRFLEHWKVDSSAPILYLTEEGAVTVRLNLGRLRMDVVSRRDKIPSKWTLPETVSVAADWLADHPGGLIVVDTYDKWAGVQNENDSAENVAAISAFYPLAEMGGAVLLIHHSRKGGGEYGEGIRGAGSILGAVDHAVELKHVAPDSDRRWYEIHGRVMENSKRLLDFNRQTLTYSLVDQSAEENAELRSWLEPLSRDGEGMTRRALQEAWGITDGRKRIGRLNRLTLLRQELVKVGRTDEYRYWRSDFEPMKVDGRSTHESP